MRPTLARRWRRGRAAGERGRGPRRKAVAPFPAGRQGLAEGLGVTLGGGATEVLGAGAPDEVGVGVTDGGGELVGVGVGVGVVDGVGVGVAVADGEGVGVGVAVADGEGVGVGVGVPDGPTVGPTDGVGVGWPGVEPEPEPEPEPGDGGCKTGGESTGRTGMVNAPAPPASPITSLLEAPIVGRACAADEVPPEPASDGSPLAPGSGVTAPSAALAALWLSAPARTTRTTVTVAASATTIAAQTRIVRRRRRRRR